MRQKLIQIWNNLPLIVSDSGDLRDISLIRIATLISLTILFITPPALLLFLPSWFERAFPYWEKLLFFTGTALIANVAKKWSPQTLPSQQAENKPQTTDTK